MPSKLNDFDEFIESDEPIEEVKLDLSEIEKNIQNYSNEKICEMIICDRYFGLEKSLSIVCMQELSKRRLAGDTFNFETYIEVNQKDLPVLDFSISDIRTVLTQAVNRKTGK